MPLNQLATTAPTGGDAAETIFKMDEDLSQVVKAVEELGIEQERSNSVVPPGSAGLPHNRSFHRDFFSDTEVEANTPHTSRPSTPIQSDSEYECSKVQKVNLQLVLKKI